MIILKCSVADLRSKEVINVDDGSRIGCVTDVEIDTCTGSLVSIIIWGKSKGFGLMGRYEDIKICWNDIKVMFMTVLAVLGKKYKSTSEGIESIGSTGTTGKN